MWLRKKKRSIFKGKDFEEERKKKEDIINTMQYRQCDDQ